MNNRLYIGIRSALLATLLFGAVSQAKAQTDSVYFYLDSTAVVSYRNTSQLKGSLSSSMTMDVAKLRKMPSLLGTADPLKYATLFPGVQTASDIDSGLRIQGCETEHNDITIEGVPIYGASHLLGLFSVFNPSHFEGMKYSTKCAPNSSRLGGSLSMTLPRKVPVSTNGMVNLGIVASDGSIAARINENNAIFLSVRGSYIYPVYRKLLTFDGSALKYNFSDINFTYLYKTSKDMVRVNYYGGRDDVSVDRGNSEIGLELNWGNGCANLQWDRNLEDGSLMKHTAWWSQYINNPRIMVDEGEYFIPSSIGSGGYSGSYLRDTWDVGADLRVYHCHPQSHTDQYAVETVLSGGKRFDIGFFSIRPSLAGHLWWNNEAGVQWAMSGQVDLSYDFGPGGKVSADAGMNNQFLFQTGVSNIGFPCNFYFLSGNIVGPQRSIFADINYDNSFCGGMYEISAQLFYKRLYNQVEFMANIYDYIYNPPQLETSIKSGDGYSYGLGLMASKKAGAFTGWISYTLSRSMRCFNDMYDGAYFPSLHDRTHELNVVANYDFRKWTFGGVMVAATGTPFTAPDYFCMVSGLLISHYAAHNSNRLRPYFRMDVSASRNVWSAKHVDIDITASLNNVTYTKNDLLYVMKYSQKENTYQYDRLVFDFALIPSISVQMKFK